MDLNKYFPLNDKVVKEQVNTLIVAIVIYLVASVVVSVIIGILSFIPVLGILLLLVSFLFGIYCLVGIVLAIIKYVN